jgi:hypothetical protein
MHIDKLFVKTFSSDSELSSLSDEQEEVINMDMPPVMN